METNPVALALKALNLSRPKLADLAARHGLSVANPNSRNRGQYIGRIAMGMVSSDDSEGSISAVGSTIDHYVASLRRAELSEEIRAYQEFQMRLSSDAVDLLSHCVEAIKRENARLAMVKADRGLELYSNKFPDEQVWITWRQRLEDSQHLVRYANGLSVASKSESLLETLDEGKLTSEHLAVYLDLTTDYAVAKFFQVPLAWAQTFGEGAHPYPAFRAAMKEVLSASHE